MGRLLVFFATILLVSRAHNARTFVPMEILGARTACWTLPLVGQRTQSPTAVILGLTSHNGPIQSWIFQSLTLHRTSHRIATDVRFLTVCEPRSKPTTRVQHTWNVTMDSPWVTVGMWDSTLHSNRAQHSHTFSKSRRLAATTRSHSSQSHRGSSLEENESCNLFTPVRTRHRTRSGKTVSRNTLGNGFTLRSSTLARSGVCSIFEWRRHRVGLNSWTTIMQTWICGGLGTRSWDQNGVFIGVWMIAVICETSLSTLIISVLRREVHSAIN